MKTSNIFQKLKATGAYNTDGMKPQLPGLQSPLKKSPYKFNAGLKKAAAEGKLDNNPKFKDAVESSPAKMYKKASPAKKYKSDAQRKAVHASKAEKASPAKIKDDGKKAKLISEKKDPKTGITTKKYDVGTNMPKIVKTKSSPAKKGCGSPVKMDIEGRKPKTRRNKAQKGVNKMLGGLANANRGCKPHRKIKSR